MHDRAPIHPSSPPLHPPPPSPAAPGEVQTDLRDLGRLLAEGWWVVAGVAALALTAGLAYLALATPVYRATALVQIEETPTDALDRLLPAFEPRISVEGEVEIMRSRMLIAPVVEQLGLDLVAGPRHFPVVGQAIARRHEGPPAPPRMGLSRYAWGGEQLGISRLVLGEELLGEPLTLVAGEEGGFSLRDAAGHRLVEGRVGEVAANGDEGPRVELLVDRLVARPGTEFSLEKRRHEDLFDQLQASLRVAERGRSTGIVAIELDGPDPYRVTALVRNLAELYVSQNVERRAAEAEKKLAFLRSQLPRVKARLEQAEASLNDLRIRNAIVDLPLEARVTIERSAELDAELSTANADLLQARQRWGEGHPDRVALERRVAATRAEREALDRRIGAFPEAQLAHARLLREVSVSTELYTLLLERTQALQVARSGTVGNVRIVDHPVVSRRPVEPRPRVVLSLALLLGLGGGVAAALARRQLRDAAPGVRELQAVTGLPVLVAVPHSARERALGRARQRKALAAAAPQDPASEQLRTLRTVLGFLLKERGNVVAVTSAAPGAGKSFVCSNLAQLLAAAGRRVLLVDADLRRGALHRQLGVGAAPGLAEVLAGAATLEAAIRPSSTAGLALMPRGELHDTPAELLARARLDEVVGALSRGHDIVILDTPPALAVTDPVLVARAASLTLFVLRSGESRVDEIAAAVERFARSGVAIGGAILNDVRPTDGRYGEVYALGPGEAR